MPNSRPTKYDPTGQAGNRKQSIQRLDRRLKQAARRTLTLIRGVPTRRQVVTNAETITYIYDLNSEQQAALAADIRAYLNEELETESERVPADWFYKSDIELPYRQGTVRGVTEYNQEVVAAAIAAGVLVSGMEPQPVAGETILGSRAYRDNLNQQYVTNYNTIKSLSDRVAAQVIQRVNAGIRAGRSPTEIAEEINERFDVGMSDAKRIAETSVNQAYTDGSMDMIRLANVRTSLRGGVEHISALTSTTRDNHAGRHGRKYTVEAQEEWWDTGTNRINCKCSVRPAILDS